MQQKTHSSDVIIVGGGLIGLLQALSLAHHGMTSTIIDQAPHSTMRDQKFDGRTSAVISSSLMMLGLLNLDDAVLGQGEPVHNIIVREGTDGAPISFGDDAPLAMVYENQNLRTALLNAAIENDLIYCCFGASLLYPLAGAA